MVNQRIAQTSQLKRSYIKRGTSRLKRSRFLRVSRYANRRWAQKVRERDGFTCRWPKCGFKSKTIHAHHINPRSQRPDLKYVLSNGAAVCPDHHYFLHYTLTGRKQARALGLLGGESYERASKAA